MLLGHASRIRAGMNGDNMMRIKWGQSCNASQLTLPSLRPWSRCPVDTAQVSQESPDWLSETQRGERELTLNRKYPRHLNRSHRLQSCVMVIVLYQRRSLHTYCQYCCHLSSFHQLRSPSADDSGWSWLHFSNEHHNEECCKITGWGIFNFHCCYCASYAVKCWHSSEDKCRQFFAEDCCISSDNYTWHN